jgi:RHS repeat-associated protein
MKKLNGFTELTTTQSGTCRPGQRESHFETKSNAAGGTLYWRSVTGDTIAETDLSGNITSEYVFFARERIARRDASNNVYFYYTDQLGSTTVITQNGAACYVASCTPYGEEHATQNTCPQNYKFTGYERDAETGLDYSFARYYNSRLGRFMGVAPMGGNLGDPQSLNRYAYVLNSPTKFVDPLGTDPFVPCAGQTCAFSGNGGGWVTFAESNDPALWTKRPHFYRPKARTT